jgi:predicted phage terminase large subunit-like protein
MTADRLTQLKAAKRLLAGQEAQTSLLSFLRLMNADPEDIDDPARSRFTVTPLARLLCQIMEKVSRRELKRVAVSVGPQMGKSEVLSRGAPAWMSGLNPYLNLILGTYNQPFAEEFGDAVRAMMNSPAYAQVFPSNELRRGGNAKDLLITEDGGRMAFVGRGGSGTGKPADVFLVDDPLKDDKEAQSDAIRNEVWHWFNKVALTRCHQNSAIVIVHTRWHQDDLIGRLCDPEHPEREKLYKGIAKRWTYINLPAVVEDPELAKALGLKLEPQTDPDVLAQFGHKPMSSIWPGRKGLEFLAEAKLMDPAGFNALYMGKPTPDDGDYFKADWMVEYDLEELPERLEFYGASDHAVSEKQDRDYTVLGIVGVDDHDNIWVLPDLIWDRMKTDRMVEEILTLMKTHEPFYWWMEGEMIAKSFGPFLFKRMEEEKVYVPIDEVSVAKDKQTRARAIQGRMAMGKVRFPRFAPWWRDAKQQLLRFPNGAHDDFVDFCAHIGAGLIKQYRPAVVQPDEDRKVIRTGSIEWILAKTRRKMLTDKRDKAAAGW